jgi:hypothetical protein
MLRNLEEPGLLRRTARIMNGQLLCGLAFAGLAVSGVVAGVAWLATAALLAAVPFLVVGVLFAFGGIRASHDRTAGTAR